MNRVKAICKQEHTVFSSTIKTGAIYEIISVNDSNIMLDFNGICYSVKKNIFSLFWIIDLESISVFSIPKLSSLNIYSKSYLSSKVLNNWFDIFEIKNTNIIKEINELIIQEFYSHSI